MDSLIQNFSTFLSNNIWLALITAFLAGIVSSFSPCVLSTIPLIVGYVGGYAGKDKRLAYRYSLIFCLGIIVTFTLLGIASALLGRLFTGAGRWWYIILGAIMLIVGLQLIGVIEIGNNSCKVPNRRKGVAGAFFLGILGGVLSSPCSTPILAAILAFVASKGNILLGVIMLFLYSVGHCVLIFMAGTSIGVVEAISNSSKTLFIGKILKILLAAIIFIIGFYLLYLGF
jgi:cytochrome c biogenesis protein CcdA